MIDKRKIKNAAKPLVKKIQDLKLRKIYEDSTKTVYKSGKDTIVVKKETRLTGVTTHRFR